MIEVKFKKPEIWLTIPQCEIIYERFRKLQPKIAPGGEPLPLFSTRYPGKLESILGSVQLGSAMLDYDLVQTAVNLYAKLARSQAFYNGNKRMSIVLAGFFLHANGFDLTHDFKDFADLTLLVSEDKASSIEEVIDALTPLFTRVVKSVR